MERDVTQLVFIYLPMLFFFLPTINILAVYVKLSLHQSQYCFLGCLQDYECLLWHLFVYTSSLDEG